MFNFQSFAAFADLTPINVVNVYVASVDHRDRVIDEELLHRPVGRPVNQARLAEANHQVREAFRAYDQLREAEDRQYWTQRQRDRLHYY